VVIALAACARWEALPDEDFTPDPVHEDYPTRDELAAHPPGSSETHGVKVDMSPQSVVRFVALGDAGTAYPAQFDVADAMRDVCAARGCDFAIYMGDNFYNTGVEAVDDPQFDEKFEVPYAEIGFPFWTVTGNHDYGGNGAGYEFWKGQLYIDYAALSDRWRFPDLYYTVDYGLVDLFGLDTTAMMWGFYEGQQEWLDAAVAASDAEWTIAYGHHPILSNGPHGNVGVYDGYTSPMPIWDGAFVKEFMDSSVCGKIDVYMCGHDHSRQWLEDTCEGTELFVSGAGGKVSYLDGENPTWFEMDTEGFLWVEIEGKTFRGAFYDAFGNLEYERAYTKGD